MRNSPRSSVTVAAVAAAALVGLASDSAKAVMEEDRHIINSNGSTSPYEEDVAITGCAEETQELAYKLQLTERELQTLRAQTHAQAEQIGALLMQLEATEANCGDARTDDGLSYSGSLGFDHLQ